MNPSLQAVRANGAPIGEQEVADIIARMGVSQVEMKDHFGVVTQPAISPLMAPYELAAWEYESQSLQVYLLIHNKLNQTLLKKCARALRDRNGFEMNREMLREMGVAYNGQDL